MTTAMNWLAATTGAIGEAGQINQFLNGHSATLVYDGTPQESETTGSGVYSSTQSQWLSQLFTTGGSQTSIGQVWLQLSTVGGSPVLELIPPLTLSVYLDDGFGAPTGTALGSVSVDSSYVYSSPFWVQVPLAISGLSSTTDYRLVIEQVGSTGHYYVWQQSDQTSGASSSTDGMTWTTETFGLTFQIFDQSVSGSGVVQFIYEDDGVRWTQFTYNGDGTINQIIQFCQAQTSGSALQQTRTLTYTSGLATGIS